MNPLDAGGGKPVSNPRGRGEVQPKETPSPPPGADELAFDLLLRKPAGITADPPDGPVSDAPDKPASPHPPEGGTTVPESAGEDAPSVSDLFRKGTKELTGSGFPRLFPESEALPALSAASAGASETEEAEKTEKADSDAADGETVPGPDLAAARLAGTFPEAARVKAVEGAQTATRADTARFDAVAEQILLALPGPGGGAGEVRIRVDRKWLADTEARVTVGDDGLSVEFVSDNVEAQRTLLPHLGDLKRRLAERSDMPVYVGMSEHADTGGDTPDGRSRNRRNLYDEMP